MLSCYSGKVELGIYSSYVRHVFMTSICVRMNMALLKQLSVFIRETLQESFLGASVFMISVIFQHPGPKNLHK